VDALPGRPLAARIRRVFPTVDPTSRQGVVEVELPRAAPALVPGLLARLTFTVAEARDALAVPLDAVRRDVRDQPYVYVVQDVVVREPAGGAKGEGEGKGDAKGDGEQKAGAPPGDTAAVRRAQIVLQRPVQLGLRGGDNWVQILRGVQRGDRVVVSGDQELSDSARVRVLPPRGPAPAPGTGGG
jgi:multidrug efflux pump subunit AcrA (membrane-fusion protein)